MYVIMITTVYNVFSTCVATCIIMFVMHVVLFYNHYDIMHV